jgi:hypothetical protein
MSNEFIQQAYSIDKCLTRKCKECSGTYISRLTGYRLKCDCKCHEKKTLEQQVVGQECSNASFTQPSQQPRGLR